MTRYEMGKYWLLHLLETYRDTPPDKPERAFIDRLIKLSRRAAISEQEKQYHNLMVLRYITDTRPAVSRICDVLSIGRGKANFETVSGHAVDRLLVLAFGIDGINWEDSGTRDGGG